VFSRCCSIAWSTTPPTALSAWPLRRPRGTSRAGKNARGSFRWATQESGDATQETAGAIQEDDDVELRREITYAIEQLNAPEPQYQPEPFDIYSEFPKHALPPFDVLDEPERLALLRSSEADVRAGAAHSFFNLDLNAKSRAALLEAAHSDPRPT